MHGLKTAAGVPEVSILVLMDLAREFRCGNFSCCTCGSVSILVLMDLARESLIVHGADVSKRGFNPCFNGSCSRIVHFALIGLVLGRSFNPCFNGSCSRIL